MMVSVRLTLAACLLIPAVAGCGGQPAPFPQDEEQPPPECAPAPATWQTMRSLRGEAQHAVRRMSEWLIPYRSVSATVLPRLVASNRSAFDEASHAELVDYGRRRAIDLEPPLVREQDGRWALALHPRNGSKLLMTFHEPGRDEPIEENPFVLESYLGGLRGQASLTVDQMKANHYIRNEIAFEWDSPTGLTHLLNGGQEVPSPFQVEVSFVDVINEVYWGGATDNPPTFGPLDSLRNLEIEASAHVTEDGSPVEYEAEIPRTTLEQAAHHGVPFRIRSISAELGDVRLALEAQELAYGPRLKGVLEYRLKGRGGELFVIDRYKDGTLDGSRWKCSSE